MREMAARTGGRAFFNTNDLSGAIRKAIEDAEVTYTLGFYPSSEELDGKFHELKVKVDRSGLDVRHRKGYMAIDAPQRSQKGMLDDLRWAIASPLDVTDIAVSARTDIVDNPRPGSLAVTVLIDSADLQLSKEGDRWVGKGEIQFVQLGPDRKLLSALVNTYEMHLTAATCKALMQNGPRVTKTLEPEAGLDQVRVVYLDHRSGKIGTLRVPVAKTLADARKPTAK